MVGLVGCLHVHPQQGVRNGVHGRKKPVRLVDECHALPRRKFHVKSALYLYDGIVPRTLNDVVLHLQVFGVFGGVSVRDAYLQTCVRNHHSSRCRVHRHAVVESQRDCLAGGHEAERPVIA